MLEELGALAKNLGPLRRTKLGSLCHYHLTKRQSDVNVSSL
jgi:hypothetical protein